jgi:hypothetical protein
MKNAILAAWPSTSTELLTGMHDHHPNMFAEG